MPKELCKNKLFFKSLFYFHESYYFSISNTRQEIAPNIQNMVYQEIFFPVPFTEYL